MLRPKGSRDPVRFGDLAAFDSASGLQKLVLGRTPGAGALAIACTDRVLASLACKRHAYMTRDRYGGFYIYDVSQSGTYVNGARVPVRAPHQLRDGDMLSLGGPPTVLVGGTVRENPYVVAFSRLTPPSSALARGRKQPYTEDGRLREHDTVLAAVSCAVCSHAMSDARNLPCGHVFCQSCALTWLSARNTCPTCRAPAEVADLRPIVGFSGLSEVAVATHGTREDIAAFRTRRQHERLEAPPEPRRLKRRAADEPIQLQVTGTDEGWVLMQGTVDGEARDFVVRRFEITG
jgi:hypothetical protein